MPLSEASLYIAAIGTIGTLILFIAIAYMYPAGRDFYFAESKLDRVKIRSNLAATATSLAGALFFFISATSSFGWIILLVPIFNVLGFMLFLHLVLDETPRPENTGSIFRFIQHKTGSKLLAANANIFVIINFCLVFAIEIIIGSQIFGYFFQGRKIILFLCAALLCFVVLWYVLKGGGFLP